jgi:hypothetical protein
LARIVLAIRLQSRFHLTVVWDAATIADDMARLTATIRFTIPEARQAD